jgi:hypothetical protein
MANLFGNAMPTIYANGETTSFQLPLADKGGRNIFFRKIPKNWTDFDDVIQERIKGYRLEGEFIWSEIDSSDLDNLINIMNIPGQKFIKFSTLPRKYPFIVTEFEPGLQNGYDFGDSARLTILGSHIVQRLPSIDEAYTIVSPYYRILNTS